MTSILGSALGAVVQGVQVETSVSAPAQIYGSGQPLPSGGGLDLGSILKPKVTIYLTGSDQPVEIAPYGDPSTAKWIVPAIVAAIFLVGYFVGKK